MIVVVGELVTDGVSVTVGFGVFEGVARALASSLTVCLQLESEITNNKTIKENTFLQLIKSVFDIP